MGGSKFWDWLEFITSLIIVGFLLVLLGNTLDFWNEFYVQAKSISPLNMLMFYIALIVTIVTVLAQWIQGRINSIIRSWNNIKGGKHGKRRKKTKGSRVDDNTDTNSSRLQNTDW